MDVVPTGIEQILSRLHATRSDPTEADRRLEALILCGQNVVALLLSALSSTNAEIRSGAALALGYVPFFSEGRYDVGPALPALIECTLDADPLVSFHAAKSLWAVSKEGGNCSLTEERIVRRILDCLDFDNAEVRAATADGMRWQRKYADLIVPRLVARLDDPALEVRFAVGQCLASLGPDAGEALPTFMTWIQQGTAEEIFVAGIAIISIDDAYMTALIPLLLDSFEHLSSPFQVPAVHLLRDVIEHDRRIVPLLAHCYDESNERRLRRAVVDVFAANVLEVPEGRKILRRALHSAEPDIVEAARLGLSVLGNDESHQES
jgi:HEAT repeat protein